jgi:hypothetical protein
VRWRVGNNRRTSPNIAMTVLIVVVCPRYSGKEVNKNLILFVERTM